MVKRRSAPSLRASPWGRLASACLALAVVLLGLCVCEAAYRKPVNPKWKKPRRQAVQERQQAVPEVPKGPPPILKPGRWDPEIRERLDDFIRTVGIEGEAYNPESPPAAVFALNDVLIANDLGEAVFHRMALGLDFKMNEAFWPLVPAAFGRHRLRADYEKLVSVPVSIWESQPEYGRLRKGFITAYRDLCSKHSRKECRAWLARLFKGFPGDEVLTYVRKAVQAELSRPLGLAFVEERSSDPEPVRIHTGIQRIAEMLELVVALEQHGIEVWILSEDYQPEVQEMARELGLLPGRGIGIRVAVSTQTSTVSADIRPPFPFRSGKVEAVLSLIGRTPALAVATDAVDTDLLSYGNGLRLLLDRGDASLRRVAVDRGWLVQRAFRDPEE